MLETGQSDKWMVDADLVYLQKGIWQYVMKFKVDVHVGQIISLLGIKTSEI